VQAQPCPGLAAVAVQLWYDDSWITVVCAYAYGLFREAEWNNWLRSLPRPVLLCGDFNAHHSFWGGKWQNRRGTVIRNCLIDQNLMVLNDGTPTFSRWHGGLLQESVLDLVLCSLSLVGTVSMTVSDDLRGSDHFAILVEGVGGQLLNKSSTGGGHSFKNVIKQGAFGCFLQKWKLGKARSKRHCNVKGIKRNPIWWTAECRRVIRDRRQALRRYKRWPSSGRWYFYIGVAAEAKRFCD